MPEPTLIPVAGGRTVSVDDVGDPGGDVVVYLHGAPDCRLARHPDDGLAARLGVRLLALDRPGYGRTDLPAGPGFDTIAADIDGVLTALGVASASVLSWSAGTPYALAAAAQLGPARITRVTSFGGMVPIEAYDDPAVVDDSRARAGFVEPVRAGTATAAEVAAEAVGYLLPEPPFPLELATDLVDEQLGPLSRREIDSVPGAFECLVASLVESVATHGVAGLVLDLATQLAPGSTGLLTAAACPVRLVTGTEDRLAGPATGRWYADRLPHADVEVWAGAGHHALFPRWADLLRP